MILTQYDYYRRFAPLLERVRTEPELKEIQVTNTARTRPPDSYQVPATSGAAYFMGAGDCESLVAGWALKRAGLAKLRGGKSGNFKCRM